MKRIGFLALTFVCAACVLSCNDDKDDAQKSMNPDDQKSFIENVAIEFTQKVPASDFEGLKAFADDISYIFDDYSWSVVGDSLRKDYFNSVEYFEEEYVDSLTFPGNYIYGFESSTLVMLALSNFTGHFVAGDSGWVYSESSTLQFDFEDANEKECVIKIAQEGKVTKLILPEIVDEDLESYDNEIYYSLETSLVSIDVPEKVIISLSQDGKDVVKATFTPKITNLEEDGYFDVGKTNILMDAVFELNNGYKTSFKTEESPQKKISASYDLSNKTGKLISCTFSGDPSGIPSYVLYYMDDLDELGDTLGKAKDLNAKNIYMSFSVLDKAQIIGRIADYKEISSLADRMNPKAGDEEYKKAVDEFNSKLDLGLYYNGSTKPQATFEFELKISEIKDQGRDEKRWQLIPVLVFSDGARVSCEEFFDEDNFIKAIEAFDALEAQYDALFEGEE